MKRTKVDPATLELKKLASEIEVEELEYDTLDENLRQAFHASQHGLRRFNLYAEGY